MRNFKYPEFHILHKLQLMQEKHPEMDDLQALISEVRDIINENSISVVQQANLYALLGKPGDLTPETRQKLRQQFSVAIKTLDLDDEQKN